MEHVQRLREDPVLDRLVDEHGRLELFHSADPFQQLVMMILEQQVSTESARAVQRRLYERFEISPSALQQHDREELRSAGLSRQKASYVQNVASWFEEHSPDWTELSDQEVVEELTSIKGVGDWTAEMFLIFGLGRTDVFSSGDLGLRRAMEELYGIEDRRRMEEKARDWSPYRSIASLYLWKWHD
jgi:DNA-3-methyladenine glycosylase II